MKNAWATACCVICVAVAAYGLSSRSSAVAQHQPMMGGDLLAIPAPASDGRQLLTVIDPRTRALGVYQIELGSGALSLKSVRNINWDLQMGDFNGQAPLPREVRAMVEQR